MPVLPLLRYPHPFLAQVAPPVQTFDGLLKKQVDDMIETMYAKNGIGLAAPQVHYGNRVIVVDISPGRESPLYLINPEIREAHGSAGVEEGCLSVPGLQAFVKRAASITVQYQTLTGEKKILEASGLLSICIQHEIDHLNGVLFINRLDASTRANILKQYGKKNALEAAFDRIKNVAKKLCGTVIAAPTRIFSALIEMLARILQCVPNMDNSLKPAHTLNDSRKSCIISQTAPESAKKDQDLSAKNDSHLRAEGEPQNHSSPKRNTP